MSVVSFVYFHVFGRLGHFQFITGDRVWVNKANRNFGAASASVVVWVLFYRFAIVFPVGIIFKLGTSRIIWVKFWLLPCHALSASFLFCLVARLKHWFDSKIV